MAIVPNNLVGQTRSALQISDYDRLVRDLQKIAPNLRKDLTRSLNRAVTPVRDQARNFIPNDLGSMRWRSVAPVYLSGSWINDKEHRGRDAQTRWTWRPYEMKRGIKITRTRFKTGIEMGGKTQVTALSVINSDAAAVIYELAGAGTDSSQSRTKRVSRNPQARKSFVAALNRRKGNAPRVLYKARQLLGKKVQDDVVKILDEQLYKFVRSR